MAGKFIHPHGRYNQKNLKHCGCDYRYCLASQGIWVIRFPDEYQGINTLEQNHQPIFSIDIKIEFVDSFCQPITHNV
jgi:hypothetical protein